MIQISLLLSLFLSFLITFIFTPKLITFLERIGLTGIDIQKINKPKIAEMGGPAILVGFLSGIFLFIWIKIFLYGEIIDLVKIFAGITTIIIITLIGMFDDLSRLIEYNIKDEYGNVKKIGLLQWHKVLLTLPAAIPLIAIMAGDSTILIPFLGKISLGIIYPLILVPIGILGASNAMNMIAGMNGLESGLGLIILTSMGIYALSLNQIAAAIIALTMSSALLAFLKYNWYPSKIFPGDSLVYAIGAAIAVVAIIGNLERFAIICFIPWFIELFLKLKSKLKAQNYGTLQEDGTLKSPNDKIYSLTHIVMKMGRFNERQIVFILFAVEILFVILAVMSINMKFLF